MRIVSRVIIILGLIALITVAGSYLYLRSSYVIEPLAKLIKEQTGFEVSIGDISYNPVYPDTVLLKRVSIGTSFEADQIYAEFDSSLLIERKLKIRELEFINSRLNLDTLPELAGKGDLFHEITIQDLHLKDFNLKSSNLSIDGSIIELSNLDILKDGRPNVPRNFFANLFANRLKYNDIILHGFNTTFHYTDEKITIEELRTNFREGSLYTKLDIYPILKQATIRKLDISGINTTIDPESAKEFSDWKFDVYDSVISNCSVEIPGFATALRDLNLNVNDLTWQNGSIEHISFVSRIGSLRHNDSEIQNVTLSASQPISNPVSHILISGEYSNGYFESYIKQDKRTDIIDIQEISLKELHLDNAAKDQLQQILDYIPYRQINFRVVNIQDIYYDSMDEYNPVFIRNGSFFANHIQYRDGLFSSSNRRSHIEIFADELALTEIDVKNMNSALTLDDKGLLAISTATAALNGGTVSATGTYDTDSGTARIDIQGSSVGFGYGNLIFKGHQTVGESDFSLALLHKTGENEDGVSDISGSINLKNVVISNMDLEQLRNSAGSGITTNGIQCLSSARNLMADSASINLSKRGNAYQIRGAVDAISRVYEINASFHEPPVKTDSIEITATDKTPSAESN